MVRLSPTNSGVISDVFVRRGDNVSAGQPVAQMHASIERANISILQGRLDTTAQIDAQEARLEFVEAQMARIRRLVDQSAQSAVRLEEIEYEYSVAQSQLAQALNDRATLSAELERAKAAYENTIIRSPVDGQVISIALNPGEFAGQDRHLITIAKLNPLHVEAFLPIQMHSKVSEGMDVLIFPDQPIEGYYTAPIIAVDNIFDTASRTFGILVELPNTESNIPGGHRCQLQLIVPEG